MSIEKLSDGLIGVGTKWRETLKVPGPKIVIDMDTTQVDPGRSFELDIRTRGMRGVGVIACQPNGDRTDLSFTVHATTSGIGWLMYPMVRWDFARREGRRVNAVKRMIESGELKASEAEAAQP